MPNWRDSIKPIKQAKKTPYWKHTIVDVPVNGKDFNFQENESNIFSLIKNYIDSIKDQLKLKFSDLSSREIELLRGPKGDTVKGKDGTDANRWYVFEKTDDAVGVDGDFALNTKSLDVLEKNNGEWIAISKLNIPKTMVSGGVSETYVRDYVAANSGGGVDWEIESTTVDITLTTQDVIIAKGTNPLTITLKNANTAEKPVVVKNRTNQTLTINVDGGANIDDDISWEISPNTAFEFVPQGGQYYAY